MPNNQKATVLRLIAVLLTCLPPYKTLADEIGNPKAILLAGGPIYFNENDPEENRTIPAEWLIAALKNNGQITITNAIIAGPIFLNDLTFEKQLRFVNCNFADGISCIHCLFKRNAVFLNTKFSIGAVFEADEFEQEFTLNGSEFTGISASFVGLHVHGGLSANNLKVNDCTANFYSSIFDGPATLQKCVFGKGASFGTSCFNSQALFSETKFEGGAYFLDTKIGGDADFEGTTFNGTATFDYCQIDGTASFSAGKRLEQGLFQKPTMIHITNAVFNGGTSFAGSVMQREAVFEGVKFNGPLVFSFAKVGRISFRKAYFKENAAFIFTDFGSEAVFQGSVFQTNSDFSNARFSEISLFSQVHFVGKCNFIETRFVANTEFIEALFEEDADFSEALFDGSASFCGDGVKNVGGPVFKKAADFSGATFNNFVSFFDAIFYGNTCFDESHALKMLDLHGSLFRGDVTLREADIQSLLLCETEYYTPQVKQFQAGFDLTDCKYERIRGDWGIICSATEMTKPYNRQPFTQLEKTLRLMGKDTEANTVLLRRLWFEASADTWKTKWLSFIVWFLAYLGLNPWLPLGISFLLIFIGGEFFKHTKAVVSKKTPAPKKDRPLEGENSTDGKLIF